jgi:hypothetical protein
MKSMIKGVSVLMLLSALSVTLLASDVHTDYNPATNFAKYHTYSWLKLQMPNSIWDQRAKMAIDQALARQGWREVETGGDAAVVANGTTTTQTKLETFYSGMDGWGWYGWGPATAYTVPTQYREGTLVVDLFDAGTKQLIWRGTATDTLSDKPEKNAEKLRKAIEKMFKKFPE